MEKKRAKRKVEAKGKELSTPESVNKASGHKPLEPVNKLEPVNTLEPVNIPESVPAQEPVNIPKPVPTQEPVNKPEAVNKPQAVNKPKPVSKQELVNKHKPVSTQEPVNVAGGHKPPCETSRTVASVDTDVLAALNDRQLNVLLLLISGATVVEASRATGIGESTIRKWLTDEVFAREYSQRRAEVYQAGLMKAMDVLREQMANSTSEIAKWRAANSILRHDAITQLRRNPLTVRHEGLDRIRAELKDADTDEVVDADVVDSS